MKRRIGIFGGSFDPPHVGHRFVVEQVAKSGFIDEIWIVPSNNHKFKMNYFDYDKRLLFCKLTFPEKINNIKIIILDIEKINDFQGSTYKLISCLKNEFDSVCEFYVVIGNDLLNEITAWDNYKKLIKEVKFIIINRIHPRSYPEHIWKKRFIYLGNYPCPEISSTQIKFSLLSISPKVLNEINKLMKIKKIKINGIDEI